MSILTLQGLNDITLSFASEAEFTPGLLRPLQGLKRLQSLTLDNRGAVQPTILGLEVFQGTSMTTLRMKGCLLCAASGLSSLTQLRHIEVYLCILMLVRPGLLSLAGGCQCDPLPSAPCLQQHWTSDAALLCVSG